MTEKGKAGFGKVQLCVDTAPGPLLDLGRNKAGKDIGQQKHEQEGNAERDAGQLQQFNGYPFEG